MGRSYRRASITIDRITMVLKSGRMVTASLSLCTPRCTPSLVLRACLLPSGSRFKVSSGGFHSALQEDKCPHHHQHQIQGRLSPKGLPPLKGVFQGPSALKNSSKSRMMKKKSKAAGRGSKNAAQSGDSSSADSSGSDSEREMSSPGASSSGLITVQMPDGGKGARWHARRRDPRLNGADLYVVRVTKNGCGNARPCWRCLEWCRWAGIKRMFHWNEETRCFDVVKVNSASPEQYETHADGRLFAGQVRILFV